MRPTVYTRKDVPYCRLHKLPWVQFVLNGVTILGCRECCIAEEDS